MGFSIGGLVSGIDTDSMVAGLVAAASMPKEVMVQQKEDLEATKSAYETLKSRLSSLNSAMEAIDTVNEFRSVTGVSSNEDAITVSVDGDAVVGRFSLGVTQLAAAEMEVSNGFASRDVNGSFGTGTFAITYGGTTTTINVDAADSNLDDVVDLINDQVEGVTAYVMDTGDATNPYRLVITGDDTGADNALSFDTSGLSGTVPTFTQATAAADAIVTLNGVTINSADNEIEGAVQGVTFNITEVTTSDVTVTVDRDTDAMVEKVQAVVDAYNAIMSYVRSQRVNNEDEGMRGAFIGESQYRSVTQGLQSVVAAEYAANTVFTGLSQLGLETQQNGDLAFDTDAFKDALSADFDATVDLITDSTNGLAAAMKSRIDTYIDDDNGLVTGRIESLAESIEAYEERISDFEERMEAYEARLKKKFLAMELAMAQFNQASSALSALMPESGSSSDK